MASACNATLNDMRITSNSEVTIVGPLTFHDLARLIGASCTLIATVLSLYLIWMHAINYTQPREQRQIIRILFMVPVYAVASLLQIQWYWNAIYFEVLSDCYEAFAIAAFFSLICHYVAPDLHSQKNYFRNMRPIIPWVMPVNYLAKCCGGEKGMWRTPKSGLTWFNIIWIGVYQYCFTSVAVTITSVVAQYYGVYCESSDSPAYAHIWVLVIESVAVTITMYFLVQFYVQLTKPLAEHKLFIKILAIKLVIFLSFWQSAAISVGTSTLNIVHANSVLSYPDIKVGIPALLLCVEMAAFAILHLWAFPYKPYRRGAAPSFFPNPDPSKDTMGPKKASQPPSGGFMGLHALGDAMNPWDFVKAFGRGLRWLFVGVKKRKEDPSYKLDQAPEEGMNMDNLHDAKPGQGPYNDPSATAYHGAAGHGEESVGLIYNAQPNPHTSASASPSPPPPLNVMIDPTITAYHGAMSPSHGDESAGLISNPRPNQGNTSPPSMYPPDGGVLNSSPPSMYNPHHMQQQSYQQQSYQQHPYQQQPYSQNQPYDPPSYGGQGPSYNAYQPPPPEPARPAEPYYGQDSWRPN